MSSNAVTADRQSRQTQGHLSRHHFGGFFGWAGEAADIERRAQHTTARPVAPAAGRLNTSRGNPRREARYQNRLFCTRNSFRQEGFSRL